MRPAGFRSATRSWIVRFRWEADLMFSPDRLCACRSSPCGRKLRGAESAVSHKGRRKGHRRIAEMSDATEKCERCGSTAIARLPGGGKGQMSGGSGKRCSMCGHQWQGAAKTPSASPAHTAEPKEAA